jgi:hypothetical protein
MPPSPQPWSARSESLPIRLSALALGAFLGLAFLKFPNPPVLEHLVSSPANSLEWLFVAWPVRYAYPLVALLLVAAAPLVRRPVKRPSPMIWLPLVWLAWVGASWAVSINGPLSHRTFMHFAVCVACFYLGWATGPLRQPVWLLGGLIGALVLVVIAGWEQHFGGLEASRQHFMLYELPRMPEGAPPELMKRMASNRIFSTLFYANSLAGALLLLTPLTLGVVADAKVGLTPGARWLLGGLIGVGTGLCLVWSGSKAGWLLAMGMGVVWLVRLPIRRYWKVGIISLLIVAGAAGFLARHLGYLKRGAPSAVQRVNYWQAAWHNAVAHPLLGSGPGTFVKVYGQVKAPEAEMARLVHNDYLQQGSDSGFLAAALFLAMVGFFLVVGGRAWRGGGWTAFGCWLGLVGLAAQSMMEFGFYVPATAWCWFGLSGWLLGVTGLGFDKDRAAP